MKHTLSAISILLLIATTTAFATSKGSVEFSVTTKPAKGKYSPRNSVVIWVTNSKGKFVKTLNLHARKRAKYLKKWVKNSKGVKIDAVSSATLKTHKTLNATWDCTDSKGKLVADGEYQIHVEFTEKNGTGPATPTGHIKFKKGAKAVIVKPKKLPYFDKMKLSYKPQSKLSSSTTTK